MIFYLTDKYQFSTRLEVNGNPVQEVSSEKLLGVKIENTLSWQSNTEYLVKRAYMRMSMLHKLYSFSVPVSDLIVGQQLEIERVQKVALRIILKDKYESYEQALQQCDLLTLKERRIQLCLSFAKKCVKRERNKDMFPKKEHSRSLRRPEKFVVAHAKNERLKKSAIPYMQRLLNSNSS